MMGKSGGRSSSHRQGRGAVARSTERQRDYVDPPPTASWERAGDPALHDDGGPLYTTMDKIWMGMVVFLAVSFYLVMIIVVGVAAAKALDVL